MEIYIILFAIIAIIQTLIIMSLNKDLELARDSIYSLYAYFHKRFNVSVDEILKNYKYYSENHIAIWEDKEN